MFIFNDTATTEIYTLSLHDALPISQRPRRRQRKPSSRPAADSLRLPTQQPATRTPPPSRAGSSRTLCPHVAEEDRKSTRLNSSHANISYAVFCLKKKTSHPRCRQVS